MSEREKYTVGWSDYRAEHGTPQVNWEPLRSHRNYDLEEVVAYIGLAISMSMVVAPMAWVQLIAWAVA